MFYMILVIVLMFYVCYLLKNITKNINIDESTIAYSFKELENSIKELGDSLDRAIEVAHANIANSFKELENSLEEAQAQSSDEHC